ncbi:helix-turn-helix transcriptional regulator [Deinococcus aquiradiocola]|uniref:HTH luxR-type domain-containing protein n=1 Tax=Deinococcus aquiradiocola TaxID=393059 RepID=A0A917PAN0_9DEIO|nr:response regulator transcription factor [Deinococcus aquiradiocola]GGJ68587.1 hypothetical protein GCM10008939_11290 [Deinococcus aquiradiocola]
MTRGQQTQGAMMGDLRSLYRAAQAQGTRFQLLLDFGEVTRAFTEPLDVWRAALDAVSRHSALECGRALEWGALAWQVRAVLPSGPGPEVVPDAERGMDRPAFQVLPDGTALLSVPVGGAGVLLLFTSGPVRAPGPEDLACLGVLGAFAGALITALQCSRDLALARRDAEYWRSRFLAQQLPGQAGLTEALTPREQQVLTLVARGHSNPEIARQLGIRPGTAKIHVERILGKLGVSDRTEAVVRAMTLGLIAP